MNHKVKPINPKFKYFWPKLPGMDWAFDITLKNRRILSSFLEDLDIKVLNKVPVGFNNNIIWNIAHTIVTQQLLVYNLSGLPTFVSEEMIEQYRKGTKPKSNVTLEECENIKSLLFTTIEKTKADYDNNIFKNYKEYTVTSKNILTNVEEAIEFNNFHEGLHLGYILALRRTI